MRSLPLLYAATAAPEEAALLAKGWMRRFVGDQRMIDEAIALYTRIGYEVLAIPLDETKVDEPCSGCAVSVRTFRVLYTRRLQE